MNDWSVTLTLALFGLSGLFFALWQHERRTAHRRVLHAFEKEYRELGVDHGLAEAKALDLEQDLERMADQRDELNRENEKLHAQVKLLLQTLNPQQQVTEPMRGKVDEDILAPPATQASTQDRSVRNARQRKGAARKEP